MRGTAGVAVVGRDMVGRIGGPLRSASASSKCALSSQTLRFFKPRVGVRAVAIGTGGIGGGSIAGAVVVLDGVARCIGVEADRAKTTGMVGLSALVGVFSAAPGRDGALLPSLGLNGAGGTVREFASPNAVVASD